MNLKTRLIKLENSVRVLLRPLLVICPDGDPSQEQQAQIDEAKAAGREVKVIRFTKAEDLVLTHSQHG